MSYEIGICGHFAKEIQSLDGQTVKTLMFDEELKKRFGEEKIGNVDTFNWRKKPLKLLFECITLFRSSNNVVILPNQNGLKIFVPLFLLLNFFFKKKLFYVVIGGWLPYYLENKKYLKRGLSKFDSVFVETDNMRAKLIDIDVTNVVTLPNFKKLNIISEENIQKDFFIPYKVCTFSRILKEKGIEDAIKAVSSINEKNDRIIYELDIFGQIDSDYEDEFKKVIDNAPSYINYKGVVPFEESVETLKNYFLLLFPTYYKGEGFAGTLIDAMASGLPVIASDWRYNQEIIKDFKNGRIFPPKNIEKLTKILTYYAENSEDVISMSKNCVREAHKYTPREAVNIFIEKL